MALAKPTFRADYANSRQLSPLETFARASTAMRINKLGALVQAAANQPRFDFDPSTLACKGLLIEPAATNLLTQSEFAAGLTDAPVRTGLVSAAMMTGFAGGIAFGYDGSTSSYAYKSYTPAASTAYALSIFVEMTDGLAPVFPSASASSALNDFAFAIGGVVVAPQKVEFAGGTRYRVSGTYTLPASGFGTNWGVAKLATNSSRTFKATGYDGRTGTVVDSYIPTATAAVTRAADQLSITGADFARIWRADEGTLVVRATTPNQRGTNEMLACVSDGTVNNRIMLYRSASRAVVAHVVSAGGNVTVANLGAVQDSSPVAVAITYAGNGRYRAALNGVALQLVATSTPVMPNVLNVGHALGNTPWGGTISLIEVYPREASIDELAEVTR